MPIYTCLTLPSRVGAVSMCVTVSCAVMGRVSKSSCTASMTSTATVEISSAFLPCWLWRDLDTNYLPPSCCTVYDFSNRTRIICMFAIILAMRVAIVGLDVAWIAFVVGRFSESRGWVVLIIYYVSEGTSALRWSTIWAMILLALDNLSSFTVVLVSRSFWCAAVKSTLKFAHVCWRKGCFIHFQISNLKIRCFKMTR